MKSDELRSLVREVLMEELSALRKQRNTTPAQATLNKTGVTNTLTTAAPIDACCVSVCSENDLILFARRVLQLAEDPSKRRAIEAGDFPFRLQQTDNDIVNQSINPADKPVVLESTINKGLINEKQISKLPRGTAVLKLGKRATITPLARDKARAMGIIIEKVT